MSTRCPTLTAIALKLERYQIEALIDWHRDEQYRCADKEEYVEAQNHREEVEALKELLAPAPVKAVTAA